MKKTLIALLAFITAGAFANPVGVVVGGPDGEYDMFKTWERCLVAVGNETSQVSCAVGYKIRKPPHMSASPVDIRFRLPVYYVAEPPSKAPVLEVDGLIYTTKRPPILLVEPEQLKEIGLSAEWRIAMFEYTVGVGPKRSSVAVVATYDQPSIEGAFRYLPLFEDGHRKRQVKEFALTAFPIKRGTRLSLLSDHPDAKARMKTRITIEPKHHQEVVIRATEANKAE